jgi:uncharacterized membrane protein YdcZ (DUF606 family)
MTSSWRARLADHGIWGYAFGYFACYVPYSYLTKVLANGDLPSLGGEGLAGLSLLPVSVAASAVGMLVFITAMRWWRYAHHSRVLGLSLPHPSRWTFLSGLCTALIIATTTLAYTFEGISIVFAMLLMRGGLLVMAPIVDAISRRKVRWFSWAALGCAMVALLMGLFDTRSYALSAIAVLDIAVYLAAYFVRLRFMSRLAKTSDSATNRRYFVEEQMTAAPMLLVMLSLTALLGGDGRLPELVRHGFTAYWLAPFFGSIVLLGLFSQGTGIFGSMIFLDRRENSFCVPVNRSSSVLAGVLASFWVATHAGQSPPAPSQIVGAVIIIVAILFLSIPPWREARRRR